jgi:hypothetical protein
MQLILDKSTIYIEKQAKSTILTSLKKLIYKSTHFLFLIHNLQLFWPKISSTIYMFKPSLIYNLQ